MACGQYQWFAISEETLKALSLIHCTLCLGSGESTLCGDFEPIA